MKQNLHVLSGMALARNWHQVLGSKRGWPPAVMWLLTFKTGNVLEKNKDTVMGSDGPETEIINKIKKVKLPCLIN
jgi:hypothetical protein